MRASLSLSKRTADLAMNSQTAYSLAIVQLLLSYMTNVNDETSKNVAERSAICVRRLGGVDV